MSKISAFELKKEGGSIFDHFSKSADCSSMDMTMGAATNPRRMKLSTRSKKNHRGRTMPSKSLIKSRVALLCLGLVLVLVSRPVPFLTTNDDGSG